MDAELDEILKKKSKTRSNNSKNSSMDRKNLPSIKISKKRERNNKVYGEKRSLRERK